MQVCFIYCTKYYAKRKPISLLTTLPCIFFCGIILSAPHSLEKVSQCEKTVLEPLKSKHKDFDSNNNNDNNNALREISRVFLLKYL